MAVPTYDQFIEPVLRFLALHPAGVAAKEAHFAAADSLGVSEQDRNELLPSGSQLVYKNRAGWAHDRLKRAGFSSSPRRGTWQITEEGLKFIVDHPQPFPVQLSTELAMGYVGIRLRKAIGDDTGSGDTKSSLPIQESKISSPDDRLGQALKELRQWAQSDLIEALGKVSPTFFESIVLDLLHRMGYGATREDLQRVGGSGDAGIDGIISLDRLGLEKVYVQAKRWQNTVGRPELQAFYGALAGHKARKGVFIATSSFTAQAMDFALSVEGIVLVDGNRLTSLMIEHEVGISSRTVRIPKIDGDYFDEEAG
ncbi:MAG: restriction endonuclease [Synechococcaceae cyanobacterium ELA263]